MNKYLKYNYDMIVILQEWYSDVVKCDSCLLEAHDDLLLRCSTLKERII